MGKFSLVIMALLLSSCYTQKRATMQVIRAHSVFPVVVADYCAAHYPPIIGPGRIDTAWSFDTLVESEPIYIPGDVDTIIRTVRVRELVTVTRTDTVENKAKVFALQDKLDEVNIEYRDINKKAKTWKTRTWALAGVLALIAALSGVKAFIAAKGWS